MSKALENFVEQYFIDNNIPLFGNKHKSYVEMVIYGFRKVNVASSTLNRFSKKYFPYKPKGKPLIRYILEIHDLKCCNKCKNIYAINNFYKDSTTTDNLSYTCKKCASTKHKIYREANPKKIAEISAKRRAAKLSRTPAWANQEAIKFFYESCPEGCHVDHIIPLQGKNISGLHIENNLQWLPAKENLKKSNKY